MIDKRPNLQGDKPRSEPEIIPPGHAKRGPTRIGDSIDARGGRVYIAKFGPLGTILLTLVVGLLSAVLMILLFGALLVACNCAVSYRRNRCCAIAILFSTCALRPMPRDGATSFMICRQTPRCLALEHRARSLSVYIVNGH